MQVLIIVLMVVLVFLSTILGARINERLLTKNGLKVSRPWREVRTILNQQGLDPLKFETFIIAFLMATKSRIPSEVLKNQKVNVNDTSTDLGKLLELVVQIEKLALGQHLTNWHLVMAAWLILESHAKMAEGKFEQDILSSIKTVRK